MGTAAMEREGTALFRRSRRVLEGPLARRLGGEADGVNTAIFRGGQDEAGGVAFEVAEGRVDFVGGEGRAIAAHHENRIRTANERRGEGGFHSGGKRGTCL
jgi:hypothetical protein